MPSITYGIIIWRLVRKTVFVTLGKLHLRAARIIYGYAWDTPSIEVKRLVNWRPLKLFYDLKLLSIVFKSFLEREPTILEKPTAFDYQNPRWTT